MSSEDVTQDSPNAGQTPRGADDAATTPFPAGFVPPEPASLAAHFPQLEIIEALGHGGMGAVYKARQPKLDRLVALKIIRPESADNPAFAERFNREARMLARMSHPHIVGIYDFGSVAISLREMKPHAEHEEYTELYYFLMEYVDGANLRQLMRAKELSPEQALAIVPQICEALQFAHDEGVVHRDIKPENILLDKRGRVKIADFGLAKLAANSPQDVTLTQTHQVMGTPRYMAPEQLEGAHSVDHRADIYSLGVVFYEMLTGEVPAGHFQPPSKKVEVDVRLDDVVLRALAREPERRYQHASDVKSDVELIAAQQRTKKAAGKLSIKHDKPSRIASRFRRIVAVVICLWLVSAVSFYFLFDESASRVLITSASLIYAIIGTAVLYIVASFANLIWTARKPLFQFSKSIVIPLFMLFMLVTPIIWLLRVRTPEAFPVASDGGAETRSGENTNAPSVESDNRAPLFTGRLIDYAPFQQERQSITLFGDRQPTAIEFILDCSGSMGFPAEKPRMAQAKHNLKQMLDGLVQRNNENEKIDVGAWFFGHRAGFEEDGGIRLQSNPEIRKWAGFPNGLTPSNDVESALRLGTFDRTQNVMLQRKIADVEPWGDTPFFLALVKALESFRSVNDLKVRKAIIAITDGMNLQREPPYSTPNDVLSAAEGTGVQINILGFDIPSPSEAAEAMRTYSEITKATGGNYVPVSSAGDLVNTLREQLPDAYVVRRSGQSSATVNTAIQIDGSQLPKEFTVAFRKIEKQVRLEGGEAIALYLTENDQRIETRPYGQAVQEATLSGDFEGNPVTLRVHEPVRNSDGWVQFPMSIQLRSQSGAIDFTPRPAETWVEITPIKEDASDGQSYVFYDRNFAPDKPVPVLEWNASNWPNDADRARIKFWCKFNPTKATQTIPLEDLFATEISVAGVLLSGKVKLEDDQYCIRIEEKYDHQSLNVDELRIDLTSNLPRKPARVVHVFDTADNTAIHSYYFPAKMRAAIENPLSETTIVITKASDIKNDALRLPDDSGVVVSVAGISAQFSPSATSTLAPQNIQVAFPSIQAKNPRERKIESGDELEIHVFARRGDPDLSGIAKVEAVFERPLVPGEKPEPWQMGVQQEDATGQMIWVVKLKTDDKTGTGEKWVLVKATDKVGNQTVPPLREFVKIVPKTETPKP